jgi:hypothetical protein
VKREKCVQKEFDRADIVRDVQIADFGQAVMETDEEKYDSEPAVN